MTQSRSPVLKTRELDQLIAEKVFGIMPRDVRARGSTETVRMWTNNPAFGDGHWPEERLLEYGAPKPYSSDIGSAFLVVEQMRARGWGFEHQWIHKHDVTFSRRSEPRERFHAEDCDTAPLAICEAALAALGFSPPEGVQR